VTAALHFQETTMKTMSPRLFRLMPLAAALWLTGPMAHAVELPRVMFVSGDAKPVVIDADGRIASAEKGVVIQPGFTVRVPEGATLQIMTPEKGIVAVRPGSLVKLESIGDGPQPYRLKLTQGGVRVANADKAPRKFEIGTPNAKMTFDKGDHEAYFLGEGKLKDGRWGTFVRGFKEDSVLTTKEGTLTITRRDLGYVPGKESEKAQLLSRTSLREGKEPANPVSFVPGAREIATTDMVSNFDAMKNKPLVPVDSTPGKPSPFTGMSAFSPRSPKLDQQKLATAIQPLPFKPDTFKPIAVAPAADPAKVQQVAVNPDLGIAVMTSQKNLGISTIGGLSGSVSYDQARKIADNLQKTSPVSSTPSTPTTQLSKPIASIPVISQDTTKILLQCSKCTLKAR
jgi:hypothetical protein